MTIVMPYGPQVLWPDHALQGIANATLHRDLDLTRVEVIVRKGFHPGDRQLFRPSSRTTAARDRAGWAGCGSVASGVCF